MKEKEIRRARFSPGLAVCRSKWAEVHRQFARTGVAQSKMRRVAAARWDERKRRVRLGRVGGPSRSVRCSNRGRSLVQSGAQLSSDGDGSEMVAASEFGVSEDEGRTQGERDRRVKVTAARPWLGAGSRSPEAVVCLGRCRQAWRNPCLKAQCFVRSIQPLFSFFQRQWPS